MDVRYTVRYMKIILASSSPRRKDLLTRMGVEFTAIASDIPEPIDQSRDPQENAKELSLAKAQHIAAQYPDAYVIGSDTIVAVDGVQMAKPESVEEARQMLLDLSKHPSSVVTGIAVVNKSQGLELVDVEVSDVYFKADSPEVSGLREVYLASRDWEDKAGAYGIQSGAHTLIDHISGHYDTIVGLPTHTLAVFLDKIGVSAQAVNEEAPVPVIE